MPMGAYLADAVSAYVMRGVAMPAIPGRYLHLFTVAPTAAAGSGTEVAGGSYAAKPVAFSDTGAGTDQAAAGVSFTGMPACTVVAATIEDSLAPGNRLLVGETDDPIVVPAGGVVSFSAAQITSLFA